MANIVTVSGMFGEGHTYFADSPVVIDISGLEWPEKSPFDIVRVHVFHEGVEVGKFQADTGGQSSISFDISSALRAIWAGYDFAGELEKAGKAIRHYNASHEVIGGMTVDHSRPMRPYTLRIYTEYMASDDGGVYTQTQCTDSQGRTNIPGGQCVMGWLTEWERSTIGDDANSDVMHWDHTGVRNGDASTKPTSTPERVGKTSITSWVDILSGYTKTIFYKYDETPANDDNPASQQGWSGHAPIVLRDDIDYVDFLFVNRRGAVETCSGQTLEAMNITAKTKGYGRVERPSFKPKRSLMNLRQGGPRRSWPMSSGFVDREWAEWWTMEFLTARQWWMLYKGPGQELASFVPVVVEASKETVVIYDRTKQQMPHVDFTVTLALEG